MKKYIVRYPLSMIAILYTIFRLLFLYRLPLFNDESIYLDWGWRELHIPGALFYSLVDGKPPFLMWVFGISESIFQDPLFAGRIIAIAAGLLTIMGIYSICQKYINRKVAILSSLLYICIPIFATFDRLALMESSIAACGVWTLYFFLKLREDMTLRNSMYLGLILGIGFFIKSNAALFFIPLILIAGYDILRSSKNRSQYFKSFMVIITTFITPITLLLLQPSYWQTLSMNSRYSLTLSELLHFPVVHTLQNLWVNAQIIFFFITPLIAILSVWGIILFFKDKNASRKDIVIWFCLSLLFQAIFVRNTSERYLVSYLPLVTIFAAYCVTKLQENYKSSELPIIMIIVLIPLVFTLWQMTSPINAISFSKKITPYTESGLIEGQISGYGIDKVVEKLRSLTTTSPAYIATAINIGNPESAIPLYFHGDESIRTGYLDKRMFGDTLSGYQCLSSTVPIYYVSRDRQQSDMNPYFEEIYRVKHPISDYSLGVYQLKSSCKGKTLQINPFQ